MGDPRKQRRKYTKPQHPWEGERIGQEKILKKEYGLKNKKEIWKSDSKTKDINIQVRNILASKSEQSKKEEKQMIDKLYNQGIIEKDSKLDDVLGLNIKKFLDRRLQTMVFNKGLAKTVRQARQFIKHHHILVGDKLIDSPSHLVLREEENKIRFNPKSGLANPEHTERIKEKKIKIIEEETKEAATKETINQVKPIEGEIELELKE